MKIDTCTDTVAGLHSPLDAYGKCSWCGKKVEFTIPKPTLGFGSTELDDAYDYHYDTNYGGRKHDNY